MAGSFSNYLELELLDHVFGGADYVRPSTIFIALSIADPLDAGTGLSEPSSNNGYARINVANSTLQFVEASGDGTKTNLNDITFATPTGSWGTITHLAIFDAISAGNMLVHASLTASKTIGADDVVKILAGELDITLG